MDGHVFNDFYHYMSDGDEEFEKFMKQKRGRGDGENAFKFRLLHNIYAGNVFSNRYTQEVVIKVIGKGFATKHLSTLIKYIGRELGHQEGEDKASVFDKDGKEISPDDFDNVVHEWAHDFKFQEGLDKVTLDGINEINKAYSFLNDEKYEKKMSDLGVKIYNNIKIFLDKRMPTKTEFAENSFIFNKDNFTYGFINEVLDNEILEVVTFLDGGELRLEKVKKENAQDVTYEVQKHYRYMPKNFTHMIFSPGGDNVDEKDAMRATEGYLKSELAARGFEYVWAMHKDTDNLHFHVIVKNQSFLKEQNKFDLNKFDLHAMRLSYARDLDGYGIDRTATLKYDRSRYLEKLKARADNIRRTDKSWWEYKLSESDNKNFDALKFRKSVIRNLNFLSEKLDEMGEHKAAKILKQEKERFTKLEPHEIDLAVEATAYKLTNERKNLGEFFTHEFIKEMGDPDRYFKGGNKVIVKKVTKEFLSHVQRSQREMRNMSEKHMSTEMLDRKLNATLQLADMEKELKKIRGLGEGRSL